MSSFFIIFLFSFFYCLTSLELFLLDILSTSGFSSSAIVFSFFCNFLTISWSFSFHVLTSNKLLCLCLFLSFFLSTPQTNTSLSPLYLLTQSLCFPSTFPTNTPSPLILSQFHSFTICQKSRPSIQVSMTTVASLFPANSTTR
jgi:hypothetical protein